MNDLQWSRFSRTALSVAVAIVAAAPALAQNTTAAVGGRVTSADGKPVAGATVVVRHDESGSVNTLTTDAEGRYSVRGLRVGGPYSVTVTKGADQARRAGVFLQLAEAANIDLSIGSAANTLDRVELSGSATVSKFDSSNSGAGTSLSRKEIDAYASVARNLQDYARIDPRLAQTDKERGEVSAMGQNSRFNSVTIDGVRINDTFGLEANNMPTAKQPISIDAIQAVQVNLSNYDVTQQGYTGANINAVTKSGTNDYKGSVYYVYRDEKMAGRRYNRTTGTYFQPGAFEESTKGFTLGGPIIKDKLFFFTNYEELHSTRSTPSFGPVGSSMTNVGITQTQIDAAIKTAKDKWGIDVGSTDIPSGVELVVKDYLAKFDWNINEKHRANVRFARTEQGEPTFAGFSSTSLSLNSYWWNQKKTIDTVVGQWFADWTEDFSTEFKLSRRTYDSVPLNNANLPQIQLTWTGAAPAGTASGDRSLFMGTENSRHFNILRTKTLDGYFGGTLIKGDHEYKFGADYSSNDSYNAFLQNTKGNFIFRGADPVALFNAGKPSTYTVQLPRDGKTLEDGVATWTLNNLGLFAQDTWTVSKALTVNYGVRVDRTGIPDAPLYNAKAETKFGYNNSETMDGKMLFQPRVGFNYAISSAAKAKSQLRGGFGLFQGAAASVWLSNPFSNTGMATAVLNCNTTNPVCPSSLVFNPDADHPSTITGTPPAANIDFLAPGLRQPAVWKANLAIDKELPMDFVVGAEWVLTKTKDGINYRNLNLGAPTGTGPDGREIFYNANALDNAKCWGAGGFGMTTGCGGSNRANRDATWGNVILAERTTRGGGNALTLSVGQNLGNLNWQAAYTYTTATEVSPLTSSTSFSNYANRATKNPNEDVEGKSAYVISNRVSGSMNWSKAFFSKYKTTVGLVYEGRAGKPYSWTFKNDMNGDGMSGNDLMYIPSSQGSGEVLFVGAQGSGLTAAQAEAKFWSIVEANPALASAKGRVIDRNSDHSKFVNSFDMRLSQELPGLKMGHKGVLTFDFQNIGNMLNKDWGRIDEIVFNQGGNNGGNRRGFVNFAGMKNGKYVYAVGNLDDYETRQNKGESQWAVQVTLRYEF